VKTRIAVLKPTGCRQGMQSYEEKILTVPTSCACAFKGTVLNDFELGIDYSATTAAPTGTTTTITTTTTTQPTFNAS
jgi:hypothetical protein